MSSQEDSQPSQDSAITVTEENRHEVLYFAYGSNLSTAQMLQRCPDSTPIGLGYLPGWRWIINGRGYANIVQPPSHSPTPPTSTSDGVYGLLYLLPPADEQSLDAYEGVPWAYEKFQIEATRVRDLDGKEIERGEPLRTLVYVDILRTEAGAPKQEYAARMKRGIEEAVDVWGMDEGYAQNMREGMGMIS